MRWRGVGRVRRYGRWIGVWTVKRVPVGGKGEAKMPPNGIGSTHPAAAPPNELGELPVTEATNKPPSSPPSPNVTTTPLTSLHSYTSVTGSMCLSGPIAASVSGLSPTSISKDMTDQLSTSETSMRLSMTGCAGGRKLKMKEGGTGGVWLMYMGTRWISLENLDGKAGGDGESQPLAEVQPQSPPSKGKALSSP